MRAASAAAAMASPAVCPKLSPLPHVLPDHLRHPPAQPTLLPFPASQHPLPCTSHPQSYLASPCPYVPLERKVFEGAQLVGVPEMELEGADTSADSSISSCFMSSNSDDDEGDTGSSSASSHSSSQLDHVEGPLNSFTSLYAALPIKRGLSRYFSGKSQSFSSLAQVSSVADLAKPENPYAKRQRTGMAAESPLKNHHSYPPRCTSILKRRTTSSRYNKSLLRRSEEAMVDMNTHPKPSKCFSAPEF